MMNSLEVLLLIVTFPLWIVPILVLLAIWWLFRQSEIIENKIKGYETKG